MDRVLVVCFLVVKALPFEPIWRRWAGCAVPGWRVEFRVHAVERGSLSPWVTQRLLDEKDCFKPTWGSVELVRATLSLLQAATLVPGAARVLLASESCLPVVTIEQVRARWPRLLLSVIRAGRACYGRGAAIVVACSRRTVGE